VTGSIQHGSKPTGSIENGDILDLGTDHIENTSSNSSSCCILIHCCGKVFTAPLANSGRPYSFHYSGSQPPCHNILLELSNLIVISCSLVNYMCLLVCQSDILGRSLVLSLARSLGACAFSSIYCLLKVGMKR
jgi:hypothetical protein